MSKQIELNGKLVNVDGVNALVSADVCLRFLRTNWFVRFILSMALGLLIALSMSRQLPAGIGWTILSLPLNFAGALFMSRRLFEIIMYKYVEVSGDKPADK